MDLNKEMNEKDNSDNTNPFEEYFQVKNSNNIYKQVFKYSIFPKIVHNMDLRIIEANDSAVKEFGYSKNELLKKKIIDLHYKVDQEPSNQVRENMEGKKKLTVEKIFRRKDGSVFVADITPCMYIVEDRPIVHVHIQNITDRKQAEEKMQELNSALELEITKAELNAKQIEIKNRELEELAYVAAHDLKAPVTNLNVLIEMIDTHSIQGDKDIELFNKLKNNIEQVYKKVFSLNDVINFKTTLKDKKELLEFKKVFKEVEQSILDQLNSTNTTLDVDFSECPEIEYPPLHLNRILHNLLTNSMKYKSPDRLLKIEVKTRKINGSVCLNVKDNGLGFDAEKQGGKVFGLFKRLHTHVEGVGVGLYIVKSIVEAHGGKIEVISRPNEGALFTIHLNNGKL
ncbi:sensor histidine kinase [Arenibacter algicola]|uniref:histidine kinase n=1 Tax=Arenibacter algicola TaxID=616991 RepID=A0A221V1M1_9FLAO|nr:PAS domain-containing sensor histidine kinase [Arenibacter algicola]ASO07494.1 phytochrome-like protein cph1 [Arenibacter algicola]|tara:strand:- start:65597 stop:66790 length:1194 start_codon:yes stop_codon:yes gene_type:complete